MAASIYTWIIVASWAAFILFWIVSAFGVKKDVKGSWWVRGFWVRIIILVVVLAYFSSRFGVARTFRFWPLPVLLAHSWLGAIGALLSVLGIGLAIWARVYLGRNWSPAPAVKEGHELVTGGPYHLVRHPIYTGIILAALGSAIVTPWWGIVFIVITCMFVWRVGVEEKLMTEQFPNQYPDYKKRTWALIPFVW